MDLLHRKAQSYKFSNKNGLFWARRDFNKTFCATSKYHKWMFKLQISSILNFDRAHQSWISGLLGVKISFKTQLNSWMNMPSKMFYPIVIAAALAAFKGSTKLIGKAISSSFPAPEPPNHGSRPGGTNMYWWIPICTNSFLWKN